MKGKIEMAQYGHMCPPSVTTELSSDEEPSNHFLLHALSFLLGRREPCYKQDSQKPHHDERQDTNPIT